MKLNPASLFSFLDSNPSEQDCIEYLEEVLWKGKPPTSPFDPTSKVYNIRKMDIVVKIQANTLLQGP